MCQKAEKSEEILDVQTMVLHNRITEIQRVEEQDETRLEDKLWQLQKRFYEQELNRKEVK